MEAGFGVEEMTHTSQNGSRRSLGRTTRARTPSRMTAGVVPTGMSVRETRTVEKRPIMMRVTVITMISILSTFLTRLPQTFTIESIREEVIHRLIHFLNFRR